MEKIDSSKVNPNDFTQKDLMIHLLNVSQHTVTREELKEDISKLDKRIDGLDKRIDGLDKRIDGLDKRIDGLDKKIDKLDIKFESKLDKLDAKFDAKFDKLDSKFDKLLWFIVAGVLVILFKEQILSLIGSN